MEQTIWTNRRRPVADLYAEIQAERERAHLKHLPTSLEKNAYDDGSWLPVLTEELGEVSRAVNDYRHGAISEAEMRSEMRKELIQLAAMAAAWVDSIDDAAPVGGW